MKLPMDDRHDSVFTARDLTKTYVMGEVQVHALRGVNLDLYEGELIVLLGPSGSGKSTLLNILGGLDTATSGNVTYYQRNLTQASEAELTEYRRYHVGFVFQFYNLIAGLTARENVALVTEIARAPIRPEEALQLVGLGVTGSTMIEFCFGDDGLFAGHNIFVSSFDGTVFADTHATLFG